MGVLLRLVTSLCLLICVSIGLAFAQPGILEETGLDIYNIPKLQAELKISEEKSKSLERHFKLSAQRAQKQTQMIDDFVEGKISVSQIVDEIQRLYPKEYLEMVQLTLNIDEDDDAIGITKILLVWLENRQKKNNSTKVQRAIDLVRIHANPNGELHSQL